MNLLRRSFVKRSMAALVLGPLLGGTRSLGASLGNGKFVDVELVLDECGYQFVPGHKIRVAVSTAYWPMVMPAPETVTATIVLGENSSITLPLRKGGGSYDVPKPENKNPLPYGWSMFTRTAPVFASAGE